MSSKPATARKPRVAAVKNAAKAVVGRPFGKGNPGRPKGAKNKTTRIQIQAAMEAFSPLAKLALDKGHNHLKHCTIDGCGSCQWWGNIAFQYVYGKPTQPIDVDSSAIQEKLQELSELTGKTVEELERDAERAGFPVIKEGRRVA